MAGDQPKPGVYPSVPFTTYRGWDAVNSSRLNKLGAGSALHFLANISDSTPSLNLGRVYHSLVLTPENFADEFLLADSCSGKTAKGASCKKGGAVIFEGDQFCKIHTPPEYDSDASPDQYIVTASAWDAAHRMMESTLNNDFASDLLSDTEREIGYVWEEPTSGLLCKGLIDADSEERDAIIDLKSTRAVSPHDFTRSVVKYGYHRQMAFYSNGAVLCDRPRSKRYWVAQESLPPWDCAVYEPSPEMMSRAAETLYRWLSMIGKCIENDEWPGFGAYGPLKLDLPAWMNQEEDD